MQTFKESLDIFKDIIPKIQKKYGKDLEFKKEALGGLSVKKDGVLIAYLNRRTKDKWDEIIQAKMKEISSKGDGKSQKSHEISGMDWDKQGSRDKNYKHGSSWTGD